MAFIDIVDKSSSAKITVFPKTFDNCFRGREPVEGDGIRLTGKYKEDEKWGDAFIADDIMFAKAI